MTNILSQAEIDELLSALSSGEPEALPESPGDTLKAKVYDFKKANKFQKEQMRTLNIVFQTFGQLLSNKLSGILRTSSECEVLSVEEMPFSEFNNSLPIPVILGVLRLPPMKGSHLLQISPEIAYTLINRLLGGSAAEAETGKQFTEIELALIQHVLPQVMDLLPKAWEKVIRLDALLERLETSPQFAQIVPLNEAVAVATLNITIGDSSGLISICIPHSSIEPISSQLNTLLWFSNSQESGDIEMKTEQISGRLINTPVSLTAYFEDTPATVADIIHLQVGDVIRLNQNIQQPIKVKVQHIPKFHAQIGTSGSRYAVRIVDIIREDNEDDQSFTR